MTCLKYLLPISCVLLMGVTLWQLAGAAGRSAASCRYVIDGRAAWLVDRADFASR